MSGRAVVETLVGEAAAAAIPDLARLRIAVFRDFPYLYDGDLAYEREYLRKFANLPESTLVVARDGEAIVGASTALPLARAEEDVIAPFRALGLDPAQFYYFGESVLLSGYRGQGIGVAFFARREERARALGFPKAAFCAVNRPATHPRRPTDYVPLDAFWTHRGYVRRPDLVATFGWKGVDEAEETPKTMTFWVKAL